MPNEGFFKTVAKLSITDEDLEPLENVLLHIRIRGLKKCTRKQLGKVVLLAFPVFWSIKILSFPFAIFGHIKSSVMSLAVAFIVYYVFESIDLVDVFMIFLIVWTLINYKSVSIAASKFLVDLLDFISFGSLTKLALYAYSTLPKNRQIRFLNKDNYFAVSHFSTTRQIWGGSHEPAWEAYFSSLATKYLNNKELLKIEVDQYWEQIDKPHNSYERHYPPSLSSPMDWTVSHEWPQVTTASMVYLLEETSDINELKNMLFAGHGSILGAAVQYGARIEIILMILKAGANVNQGQVPFFGKDTFSILYLAVISSSTEVVQLLIDSGAEIDKDPGINGYNIALTAAAFAKHPETLRAIVQIIDDQLLTDKIGRTMLHYAVVSPSDRSAFIEVLVDLGHDINRKSNERVFGEKLGIRDGGETPLVSYLNRSNYILAPDFDGSVNLQTINCLLKHGADVNATAYDEKTALHAMAKDGYRPDDQDGQDVIEVLLDHGANVNAKDDSGKTPLHVAAKIGRPKTIKLLIDLGADIGAICALDNTPVYEACNREIDRLYSTTSVDDFFEAIEIFLNCGLDMKASFGSYSSPQTVLENRLKSGDFALSELPTDSLLLGLLNIDDGRG